jgi:low affinity Fe/Cu permease
MRANMPVRGLGGSSEPASSWFAKLATKTAHLTGKPVTFLIAATIVIIWAVSGPIFGYSDTWQLVINTGTTIVTFLMVFLIQATQNRDTLALQLKLDELIVATQAAHNEMAGIEEADEKALDEAKKRVLARSRQAAQAGHTLDPVDVAEKA